MDFEIHLLEGVNDIAFGMTPDQVRSRMSGTYKIIEYEDGGHPTDAFLDHGVLFRYSDEGRLEICEFIHPARTWLGSFNVMALTVGQAIYFLSEIDPSTKVDAEAAIAYKAALCVPMVGNVNPDLQLEALLVAKFGYY